MPTTAGGPTLSRFLGDAVRQQSAAGGSPGGPATDAASVTRAQWQHFLDTYRPVEDEVLNTAMNTDLTQEGDQAGATAAQGVKASRGMLQRQLSRSGATLSAEERAAIRRREGSTLAKVVGQAENTTRRGLSEHRTNLLRGAVQIGRGVANTATSGLQSVADMAAQRESLYQQQRAESSSTNLSAAASAAALVISFI